MGHIITTFASSETLLSSLPWLLLPLLFFIIITRLRSQKTSSKSINLPPGPPRLPLIGNLHQLGKVPHQSLQKLSQKYGPVMLLHLGRVRVLIVSSPEAAQEVTKTYDLACCSRADSYGTRALTYNYADIAFAPYSEYGVEMRKFCMAELFTLKRVKSFSHVRESQVCQLMEKLSQNYSPSRTPINVNAMFYDLTYAVICRITFGKGYEGTQFESGKVKATIDDVMAMLSNFWVSDFFPAIGWVWDVMSGKYRKLDKCHKALDGLFEMVIEDHLAKAKRGENQGHEDFTDILIRMSKDPNATFTLSRDHIKAILMDVFLGGIDTSSVTMGWAMTELTKNPRVMKKVQQEIRQVVGNKPKVDESDVEKLTYLKNVVKETFRLHTPSPLLVPRESLHHCKINGYDVFPKTRILVGAWAMGRDPKIWKNPEEFYPERFDNSDIDWKGSNFELIPFGAGRRSCPGMTMGATAVEFNLANLLHGFDWELPPGTKREDITMEEEAGLTTHKKIPLYLVPIKHKWD